MSGTKFGEVLGAAHRNGEREPQNAKFLSMLSFFLLLSSSSYYYHIILLGRLVYVTSKLKKSIN